MPTPEGAGGAVARGVPGKGVVVIVVAGDPAGAGQLATELERAGLRVAVFDPGRPPAPPAEVAAAVAELAAELFATPPAGSPGGAPKVDGVDPEEHAE